ncbi:hypothetical protein Smar_1493 [Staphylothermus marinus F1]|uniref:DUF4352 domain-containing protein n=1 Tax=Staphylothermus marinus (strain ATCC 43588 / DSM 3639 / JCM 9404 / F1) TaxID=399550 RepID=A3DPM2_STAMF|nr:hypothetical protein [Staphylothermus marinus]ABN70582.1 hypothetical protein Smar_1493 [Staphylothermus marinus F1]
MKAISPVIATVIIVAVAIAISIAVALWITGLTSSFTGVEKLEVVNAYAELDTANNQWIVHLHVKNTGTKAATIDDIFINSKPYSSYNTATSTYVTLSETLPKTLNPGEELTDLQITISTNTPGFASGQTVSIVIHTASGGQYPATVTLP